MITVKQRPWWWKLTGIQYIRRDSTLSRFERGQPVSLCALFWAVVGPWLALLTVLALALLLLGMIAYDIWLGGHMLVVLSCLLLTTAACGVIRYTYKYYSTSDTAQALVAAAKARVCPLIRWERN